jgi:hypothetical protein
MESIRSTSLQAESADFVAAAITEYIAPRLGVSVELMRRTSDLMGSHPLNLALRFLLEATALVAIECWQPYPDFVGSLLLEPAPNLPHTLAVARRMA